MMFLIENVATQQLKIRVTACAENPNKGRIFHFFVCVHFVIVHGFTSRVQWVRKCGAFECQRKYVTWAWLRSCDAVSFLRPDVQRPDGH